MIIINAVLLIPALLLLMFVSSTQSCQPVTLTVTRASSASATRQSDGTYAPAYPLSSVNVANVQGALKYVQTETIDRDTGYDTAQCQRKNGVTYIHFYALTVCNSDVTLEATHSEYGPFVAFDAGACHADAPACGQDDDGGAGPVDVGVQDQQHDRRGPYPGALWYSLPGRCPRHTWQHKPESCHNTTTDDHHTKMRSGKCLMGVVPDGVHCTWSTSFLGQVNLDELVGITSAVNPHTRRRYVSAREFCLAGQVEFQRHNATYALERGLGFWHDPLSPIRNTMRTQALVRHYGANPDNRPLPTPATLSETNPACYENMRQCRDPNATDGTAALMCERDASQRCRVCRDCGRARLPRRD